MHEAETNFHNLEWPLPDSAIPSGWQLLRGWLVPKRGFHFADVRARRDDRIFPGVYGFPRADLAAHFEPGRAWLPAEYTIEVELSSGPNAFAIEALDIAGHWQPIQTVVVIGEGTAVPRRKHDPLCAEEVGLAVQLCLRQSKDGEVGTAEQVAASIPHPSVLRANHPPFHGFIDEPAAISPALYGRLHVLGWLFHETLAIKQVSVSTELLVFHPLELGGEFAGVKERFPEHSHAGNCRLFGFADVSSQLPSPVSARFYAELEDGTVHLVLAVQCCAVETESLKAAYPPFSFARFWSDWRNLQQALLRRPTPTEEGTKLFTQLAKSLLQYLRDAPPDSKSQAHDIRSTPRLSPHVPNNRFLLITHNLNLEGAPLLFVEYARHLKVSLGAQLVVLSGREGPLRIAFAELGAEVVLIDPADLLSANSIAEFRRRITAIAKKIAGPKFDAVVANTLSSFWGVELASALGCPSLLYLHESTNPVMFFGRTLPDELLPAVFRSLEDATAVSFNTPATQAYYQPFASRVNFHLTPAWIDLSRIGAFRASHPREILRKELNLAADELLIANVGTVCDRKGQHDFIRAVELFWRRQPELARRCRFAMIGGRDTPYNRFLQESLAQLRRPNLAIVAETSRAYDYFGAADLFVCTSYEESFPRVVLEAMAFEIPIVTTNVHGIPYLLKADGDALLVNPGDIAALAGAMQRALENPPEAKVRKENAWRRVQAFDAAVIQPQHAALTARVASAPDKPVHARNSR